MLPNSEPSIWRNLSVHGQLVSTETSQMCIYSGDDSIQDDCKTSNDVRCRYVGSEEITREEVGCGGNEDVKMDEWSHQAGQNWE